jgi:phage terminase Nu1 subunit (DNA packaging protein)
MQVKASEVAEILDISEDMVRKYARSGVFVRLGKNLYDLKQCVKAYYSPDTEPGLTEERTRLTKYQADKTYLELQEKRRELWPVRICLMYFSEVVKAAQNELLALKNNIKMDYPDIEDQVLIYIDTKIREALEHASSANTPHGLQGAVETWAGGDVETAAEVEGE